MLDARYVVVDGRPLLRVAGGENDQPEAAPSLAEALESHVEGGAEQSAPADGTSAEPEPKPESDEQPDIFAENFDPATLPDEVLPAYHQMRSAFTQKTQGLAEERRELEAAARIRDALLDPDQAPELLRALGYDVEGLEADEQPEGFIDPDDPLAQRIAAIEQGLAQGQEQAQQAENEQAIAAHYWQQVDGLEKGLGREFTEQELKALGAVAAANTDEHGLPSAQAAYDLIYAGVIPEVKKRWAESKDATHVTPSGSSADHQPDLRNRDTRQQHILERIAPGADT